MNADAVFSKQDFKFQGLGERLLTPKSCMQGFSEDEKDVVHPYPVLFGVRLVSDCSRRCSGGGGARDSTMKMTRSVLCNGNGHGQ